MDASIWQSSKVTGLGITSRNGTGADVIHNAAFVCHPAHLLNIDSDTVSCQDIYSYYSELWAVARLLAIFAPRGLNEQGIAQRVNGFLLAPCKVSFQPAD